MRRLILPFLFLVFAWLPAKAQNDAQIAQALVGKWVWQSELNGAVVNNELTLTGSGTFAYTTTMQTYMVFQAGAWMYQGGYLMFRVETANADGATTLGPIQILDVGPDYVRTPAGIARRAL